MADYIACFRMHRFPVRDAARFRAWIDTVYGIDFTDEHEEGGKPVFEVGGYGSIPDLRDEDDELIEVNVDDILDQTVGKRAA